MAKDMSSLVGVARLSRAPTSLVLPRAGCLVSCEPVVVEYMLRSRGVDVGLQFSSLNRLRMSFSYLF